MQNPYASVLTNVGMMTENLGVDRPAPIAFRVRIFYLY